MRRAIGDGKVGVNDGDGDGYHREGVEVQVERDALDPRHDDHKGNHEHSNLHGATRGWRLPI